MKNMWGKELKFPEDVYYTEKLLWVKDLGANKVRIGLSDLAAKSVKKLVHIKMEIKKNAPVEQGDLIASIETTKGIWEVIAPLSGTLIEISDPAMRSNSHDIEIDTYGDGWLVEMEIADNSQLKTLLDGSDEETKKWILDKAEEIVPLREEDDDDDD